MLGTDQAEALKRFRERRNLTLTEISTATNWSKAYLSQIFSGDRPIPENLIQDLDLAYELQPDERKLLRTAIRSAMKRIDLRKYSPRNRAVIATVVEEIGDLETQKQKELLKFLKGFLKLEGEERQKMLNFIPEAQLDEADWKFFDFGTGHDNRLGLRVKPLSRLQISRIADDLRAELGLASDERLDIVKSLDAYIACIDETACFSTVPEIGDGCTKGYTDVDERKVVVTNDVYLRARHDDPNALWVLLHEVGHLALHTSPSTFDFDGVGIANAERQANFFARSFAFSYKFFQETRKPVGAGLKRNVQFSWLPTDALEIASHCKIPIQEAQKILGDFQEIVRGEKSFH